MTEPWMAGAAGEPLLILDGRFVSAERIAAAIAQRPPHLPAHRWVIWGSAEFPLGAMAAGSVAVGERGAGTIDSGSNRDCGGGACLGQSLASALGPNPETWPRWVGYGLLDQEGGWPFSGLPWPRKGRGDDTRAELSPWLPPPRFPTETAQASPEASTAWIASADLVVATVATAPEDRPWSWLAVAESLEQQGIPFRWQVWAGVPPAWAQSGIDTPAPPPSQTSPRVLAMVPHYRCEPWLRRCLASLVAQTRPPDGIVVIDDGSSPPPLAIVAEFPSVTLLTSPATVGPYRLVQQVIQDTAYDYYLFQDADDWAFSDRLAHLLTAAEQTQADLIGTQELRWDSERGHLIPVHYPLDVNLALADKPGHPLLHPTSLVRRQWVMQVGGFATGLRFGGDTEFLLRGAWVGRILNLPTYGYLRQKRPHSLTTDPHTGLDSPDRLALLQTIKQRFYHHQAAHRQGHPLDLTPLAQAPPLCLRHQSGPALLAHQP
ncbi:MAG: glycosyltransferase family A protein [Leptolyngbya sp.]|nr:glycosyltransferase family A protein [Leptolyngbya sp.]